MKLAFEIEDDDVKDIVKLYELYKNRDFVKKRILQMNDPLEVTRDLFWKQMVTCLLTSQQKSGPNSHVSIFERQEPFALNYVLCKEAKENLHAFVSKTISKNRMRFGDKIGKFVVKNYDILENREWDTLLTLLNNIKTHPDSQRKDIEREAAKKLDITLKGFGPKQARNFLTSFGLAKYEVPIDSRVMDWLQSRIGKGKISVNGLSDENYYLFVENALQEICYSAGLIPTIVDAILFERKEG